MLRLMSVCCLLFVCASGIQAGENLLKSGGIVQENGWITWLNKNATDGGVSIALEDGKAEIRIPVYEGANFSDVQLIVPIDVEADKDYTLKLTIDSDMPGKLTIGYGMRPAPHTGYSYAKAAVEKGEKTYDLVLKVRKAADGTYASPRVLRMHFGDMKGATLTVSAVSLTAD